MLDDLAGTGADGLLCTGDVVGYGADPSPVVEVTAGRAAALVAGNHDHAAAGRLSLEWFNPYARAAAEWTALRLSPAEARFLGDLPLRLEHAGAVLVHASPAEPEEWPYVVTPAAATEAFAHFRGALCFIGHSHLPAVWSRDARGRVTHRPQRGGSGRLPLAPDYRYLVNVGSVGQPRDGDPLAAYVLWDAEAGWIEFRRVPYDAHEARARIRRAGLPRMLGDRLLRGR